MILRRAGLPDTPARAAGLVTEAQVYALLPVIGAAICAAPADHDGPCRIAWSASCAGEEDAGDAPYGLDTEAVAFNREHLAPIGVWPQEQVDATLGIPEPGEPPEG